MVLLLLACAEPGGPSFVAPFDGATGLSRDTVLRVRASALRLPEGEPVAAEILQVVDLDDGAFVEGEHVAVEGGIEFRPDQPFAEDHDFGWAVLDAPPDARRPVVELDPALIGDALFSTRSGPRPLDATVEDGRLCLLFSEEPLSPTLDLEVDGTPWPALPFSPLFLFGPGGADGTTAACVDEDVRARPDRVVRVFDEAGGSSTVVVVEAPLHDLWLDRHRWVEQ